MTTKRWNHSNKAVYHIGYHLIWCPKYRRKVLTGQVAVRLEELLKEKASHIDINIISIEILEDHVHLFISSSTTNAPHWVVQQLKGYTSRILRQEFPHLKSRLPTLWTRSYFAHSVGHISEDVIKKYIEDQKNK